MPVKLALLIEYDGTDFAGWQVQENSRTVQGEITSGLERLFQREVTLHGAGRTDSGVHGRGMVAHFEMPEGVTIPDGKLLIAMNAVTGPDVVIRGIRRVPDDFHARFSALSRQYRYTIRNDRSAIDRRVVWSIKRGVDREALRAAAAMTVGEHDFTSFSKRSSDVEHYRCLVEEARWDFHGTTFALTIRANRFVRGMVRALVGSMVQVGQGAVTLESFSRLLDHPEEYARAKYIAPAHGLVLEGVAYPDSYGLWRINEESAEHPIGADPFTNEE